MDKELDVFAHFLHRLSEYPAIKIGCGVFVWLIRLMFGTVFRPAYGVVGLLWIIDTITGYYHAWANPAVVPESRRMYHGLVKITIYYFLMLLGYQISRTGFDMMIMLQVVIETAIILTELKSILENIKKIADLHQLNLPFIDQAVSWIDGKIQQNAKGGPR